MVRGVYSVIDQLSRTHLSTLERLIFHLVRYVGPRQLWARKDAQTSFHTETTETKSRWAKEREELLGPSCLPGGGPRAASPNDAHIDEQPLQRFGCLWCLWVCGASCHCRDALFGWEMLVGCLPWEHLRCLQVWLSPSSRAKMRAEQSTC